MVIFYYCNIDNNKQDVKFFFKELILELNQKGQD